ncbi:MAG: hypothetical protein COU63_01085 [Candidatus Pacebacteria bacterium CG10_big_fil_rev_8_21_14_0_10_36_11]|nr:hypothetical protein [Candidatus Pacearchaeota archaeon]OIP73817.1 MAG: hypothetical protein AUK08_04635 [Candidatus Pacebacteria bacterium CG2_30_36_39]PIR64597.1 MAG: hypothetical protein COU63_01085 [Candidatus Pacebacteria bacterium CG10_big_fil_rev_8_21_14_0_10_36_11]PJC42393.1 MAG: hypothetical protein CO040_04775 [Candidatus Pacebacteria bacterium CG_4_9_14_0_2_um_filter_36_8]
MKMKKAWLFLLFIIFLGLPQKAIAKDLFPELESLEIDQKLPQEIQDLGKETKDDVPETIFLEFESSSKSYPHYIEITPMGKIVYMELKIPDTHVEIYQNILTSLGEPETKEETTPSYVLLAYPSKGIGFIVNERNRNFLMQTRFPKKSVTNLKANEAKNFIQVSQLATFPTGILSPIPTEPPIPKDLAIINEQNQGRNNLIKYVLYTIIGLIVLWAIELVGSYFKRKKQDPPKPKIPPTPPMPIDPPIILEQ